jgi:pimeloyl-ACP methyl ester carboxylesterase
MDANVNKNILNMITDAYEYWYDASQRTTLFMDIMRKRGNMYLDHLKQGQPPVLDFDFEIIMDARTFDRPANYALVRIIDRRDPEKTAPEKTANDVKSAVENEKIERRRKAKGLRLVCEDNIRPIVIVDPRAGHGPGIGGSKHDSQIGMALDNCHPVYFMIFFTEPMPDQTLADVRNAQIRFVEEVGRRHPNAPKPAIIGNCQGGWAAALIGAERPDLVGPMVFNGAPLSYWGGVEGVNPMRYLGGLWGGVWINSFLSDLGGGKFDGANLVANFENLNPANTLWSKQYHVYANVDTEEDRYLNFEKWWGGFFMLNKEEIHTIVDGLFVGNKLEQGEFELEEGRKVDLKHNNNPVVVFASFGDNITPPQQAFNWIVKTYGTVEEIKRRGQVIVCIGHEKVGHLGIFVSARIARKEHKEIISSFDILDYLPPGLYQMKITEDPKTPGEYIVDYVEKNMEDIMAMDDGLEDEDAFFPVRTVSRINDTFYELFVSPWVKFGMKLAAGGYSAEILKEMHPMRTQRYLLSDLNPMMEPVKLAASEIRKEDNRQPASEDNIFKQVEKNVSESIVSSLDLFRDMRDSACEQVFKLLYENPWMKIFEPAKSARESKNSEYNLEELRRQDGNKWRKLMAEGNFPEAMTRIFLAVGLADHEISREGYELLGELVRSNRRMKDISDKDLQQTLYIQARILQTDTEQAIDTLKDLLPTKTARKEALSLIRKGVKMFSRDLNEQEQVVLEKIKKVIQVPT